jgi:hypothetical protein
MTLVEKIRAGKWPKAFAKSEIEAPDGFNRWLSVPPSFMVQLSIGSAYVRSKKA